MRCLGASPQQGGTEVASEIPASERRLLARVAAHRSWARTDDRSARTANARAGLEQKFLDQAGGDPVKAEHLRKAYYAELALKSAQARRKATTEAAGAGHEIVRGGQRPHGRSA
jgi:hypothetical protein